LLVKVSLPELPMKYCLPGSKATPSKLIAFSTGAFAGSSESDVVLPNAKIMAAAARDASAAARMFFTVNPPYMGIHEDGDRAYGEC
jgi:hypothetical protein